VVSASAGIGEFEYHRPLVPLLRGFARGAKVTEVKNFSIAVERTAMENHSVPALCAGTGKAPPHKFHRDLEYNSNAPIVEGSCPSGDILFEPLRESTSSHRFEEQ
jgi:hypothetical protein